MTRAEIHEAVVRALRSVAPEIDAASLRDDVPLRDQVDVDSMDFLRFIMELHRTLDVEVPEADYGRLLSITATVEYLVAREAAAPRDR